MNISLRKITESDTANIVRWRNSDDVKRWLYSQEDLTPEMHLGWLKNVVAKGLCAQYIIIAKDGVEEFDIGTTFIKRTAPDSINGEFGIFIGEKSARGKHCALPATIKMLSLGFKKLNLNTIFLTVFAENIPAVRTYLKAGFIIKEEHDYKGDRQRKILKMEISRECFLRKETE